MAGVRGPSVFKLGSLRSSFICNVSKQLICLKTNSGLKIAKPTRCCFAGRVKMECRSRLKTNVNLVKNWVSKQNYAKRGECESNTSLRVRFFQTEYRLRMDGQKTPLIRPQAGWRVSCASLGASFTFVFFPRPT